MPFNFDDNDEFLDDIVKTPNRRIVNGYKIAEVFCKLLSICFNCGIEQYTIKYDNPNAIREFKVLDLIRKFDAILCVVSDYKIEVFQGSSISINCQSSVMPFSKRTHYLIDIYLPIPDELDIKNVSEEIERYLRNLIGSELESYIVFSFDNIEMIKDFLIKEETELIKRLDNGAYQSWKRERNGFIKMMNEMKAINESFDFENDESNIIDNQRNYNIAYFNLKEGVRWFTENIAKDYNENVWRNIGALDVLKFGRQLLKPYGISVTLRPSIDSSNLDFLFSKDNDTLGRVPLSVYNSMNMDNIINAYFDLISTEIPEEEIHDIFKEQNIIDMFKRERVIY